MAVSIDDMWRAVDRLRALGNDAGIIRLTVETSPGKCVTVESQPPGPLLQADASLLRDLRDSSPKLPLDDPPWKT